MTFIFQGIEGEEQPDYGFGLREDKTQKGLGYFGNIDPEGDKTVGELSIGVNFDGKEHLIPSIVPTLSKEELDILRSGKRETPEMLNKAVKHAKLRLSQGKSPFAQAGEQQPLPEEDATDGFVFQGIEKPTSEKKAEKVAKGLKFFGWQPETETIEKIRHPVGVGLKGLAKGTLGTWGEISKFSQKLTGMKPIKMLPTTKDIGNMFEN